MVGPQREDQESSGSERAPRLAEMRDFIARITAQCAVDRPARLRRLPGRTGAGVRRRISSTASRLSFSGSSAFISDMALAAFERDLRRSGIDTLPRRSSSESRRRRANSASRGPTSQAISTIKGRKSSTRRSPCSSADGPSPISSAARPGHASRIASPSPPACSARGGAPARPSPARRRAMRPRSRTTDVSNRFYRLVLGPSMTYSCALSPTRRQRSRRRRRRSTSSLPRSSGCARGCASSTSAAGGAACSSTRPSVTASGDRRRHLRAARPSSRARVLERVSPIGSKIRLADYRDVADGPYDAISSIGMFGT